EEAMDLFKLPKKVGIFEDKEMTVAVGRFGPYIRHNSAFYSLPKSVDPLDVTEEQAIEIIKDKRQKDKDKVIRVFAENPDAQIENGRWGPFIRFGKQNIKIPKGIDVEKVVYADVLKWAEEDPKASKATKVKKTAKKATAKKK
ncbi:MAG TPA: topoisomerase C-terminal repeat-containing protein, partial [Sphingobacterium sp.]|nr:topoisomerase C-terminal repeat-containing protein [Sphingobacterium sp.]